MILVDVGTNDEVQALPIVLVSRAKLHRWAEVHALRVAIPRLLMATDVLTVTDGHLVKEMSLPMPRFTMVASLGSIVLTALPRMPTVLWKLVLARCRLPPTSEVMPYALLLLPRYRRRIGPLMLVALRVRRTLFRPKVPMTPLGPMQIWMVLFLTMICFRALSTIGPVRISRFPKDTLSEENDKALPNPSPVAAATVRFVTRANVGPLTYKVTFVDRKKVAIL